MPPGRPKISHNLDLVRIAGRVARSQEHAAEIVGMSPPTFKRRMDEDPEFRAAFEAERPEPPTKKGTVLSLNIKKDLANTLKSLAANEGKNRHALIVDVLMAYVASVAIERVDTD